MPSQELKYQTFWPRFNAALIDSLLFMAITYAPRLIWEDWRWTFTSLMADSVFLIYTMVMHGVYGKTLGKMLYKVKVIDVSEKRGITGKQALMRDLIPLVLILFVWMVGVLVNNEAEPSSSVMTTVLNFISIGWLGLELATALLNKKSRALHDVIAKTVVIRE